MTRAYAAIAAAKVNLSLRVVGRRADGYHQLESLVAFAQSGDRLDVALSEQFNLDARGATASRIDGPNLIAQVNTLAREAFPDLPQTSVVLDKALPVGAGVGGGSADAAAYLRALRALGGGVGSADTWAHLALRLGADVPVCVTGCVTWMRGVGEMLDPVACAIPGLPAVLVNSGDPVATEAVFSALEADCVPDDFVPDTLPDLPSSRDGVIAWLADQGNDLERPAIRHEPGIAAVRDALRATVGVGLVRMSGSGGTFFALYDTPDEAQAAANALRAMHPEWWIVETVLGPAPRDPGFNSHG